MYKIYWTDHDGQACSQDETDLALALKVMNARRSEGQTFVAMAQHDPNQVGKLGVDAVEAGKTPDGHDYDWSKAGRAGKPRRR